MSSLFPSILIAGPPRQGKSVLAHRLSMELRQRQGAHDLLGANPDGEGDWYHQAPRVMADQLREKRPWNATLLEQPLVKTLADRSLPLPVDAGGRPTPSQTKLFDYCTHSLFLGENESKLERWRNLGERYQPQPLAEVLSTRTGEEEILEKEGTQTPLACTLLIRK